MTEQPSLTARPLITIQRAEGGPLEAVPEDCLIKRMGLIDNDHERTTWVEYRLPGSDRIVHRSAHVTLKEWPPGLGALLGQFE